MIYFFTKPSQIVQRIACVVAIAVCCGTITLFYLRSQKQTGETTVSGIGKQAAKTVLTAEEKASIESKISRLEYQINYQAQVKALQSPNRAQNLRFTYSAGGFEAKSRKDSAENWHIALQVKGIGRKGEITMPASDNADYTLDENQLVYHQAGYDIEYLNTPEGMRQNFIVAEKPQGNGELTVSLKVLAANLNLLCSDNTLTAMQRDEVKYRYSDLKVWDADHKTINAGMALRGTELTLCINDNNARYPLTIDPLSSTPSVQLESNQASANLGWSVSTAGDVNGDGYSDIIAGAYLFDNGQADEGAAFVFHGSADGITSTIQSLLESNQSTARLGNAVSTAGDVNGDGYSDVIVGAYLYDNGQGNEGGAYIYLGSSGGLNTTPQIILESNQATAQHGYSVACAGDVNNDGYSDIIIGTRQYDNGENNEGAAFIHHGSASGITATVQRQLESNQIDAQFGFSVASAGDVNGDGYSDVIVGSWWYDNGQTDEGAAFIYHGSASGVTATIQRQLESNQADANMGRSVASAGDVNGDGYSDVIIGAPLFDNGQTDEGAAFIYHGSIGGITATLQAQLEVNQGSAAMGFSVAGAGDINGDGYSDVIAGAYVFDNGQTDEGAAFVYHGASAGVNTTAVTTLESNQADAQLGFSVAPAGDVNGDGFSDVITGAVQYDNGQADEGAAFTYHGAAAGLSTTYAILLESNQLDARMGLTVSTAGDVNGDGYDDVIVGAFLYDNGQADEGAAFIYHGSATGITSTIQRLLEINISNSRFGSTVTNAGDVNGDGYGDVAVSAEYYANGQTFEGAVFIYHGSATGISNTLQARAESNKASSFMNAVACAGDVNGDGYSDIIAGATGWGNGQTNEGCAFVYHGSATGIDTSAANRLEYNQANASMGVSVSSAGDVNGDGFSDVMVGSILYDNGQTSEGTVLVYHGSSAGITSTVQTQLESNQAGAAMGRSIACAGDVNGDGYSDIIVGVYAYDNGQTDEGLAYVYHGSASGITNTIQTTIELNQASARVGHTVCSAGDVNGDGYSDILVGADYYDNGETDEGAAFLFYGSSTGVTTTIQGQFEFNQSGIYFSRAMSTAGDVNGDGYSDVIIGGLLSNGEFSEGGAVVYMGNGGGSLIRHSIRLYNNNLTTIINSASIGTGSFGAGLYNKSFNGRDRGRMVWELRRPGLPYSSAGGRITNSVSITDREQSYSNLGLSGAQMRDTIVKIPWALYNKFRSRVQYPLNKAITGQTYGPWRYVALQQAGIYGHSMAPLPVEWLFYQVTPKICNNIVEWQVDNSPSVTRFDVYFAENGNNYKLLGSVTYKPQNTAYTYEHFNAGAGSYMIKAVNINHNSDVVYLGYMPQPCGNNNTVAAVLPNPTASVTQVTVALGGDNLFKGYSILSSDGSVVEQHQQQESFTDSYHFSPDLSQLPQGMYIIEMQINNLLYYTRVIRQ